MHTNITERLEEPRSTSSNPELNAEPTKLVVESFQASQPEASVLKLKFNNKDEFQGLWMCADFYRCQHKLGEGAFGDVYLVTNQNQKSFAVKISNSPDEIVRKEFASEAKANKDIYGVGEFIYGSSYGFYAVVMLYQDGVDLDNYLVFAGNDTSKWVAAIIGALEALHMIHDKQYVHGDASADNFIVTEDDVKAIDFGWTRKNNANDYRKDIKYFVGCIMNLLLYLQRNEKPLPNLTFQLYIVGLLERIKNPSEFPSSDNLIKELRTLAGSGNENHMIATSNKHTRSSEAGFFQPVKRMRSFNKESDFSIEKRRMTVSTQR